MRNIVKQTFMCLSLVMAAVACDDASQPASQGSAVTQPDAGYDGGASGTSGKGGAKAANGGSGASAGSAGKAATAPLTDPQIVDVLIAVNAGEVEQNTFAVTRAQAPEVRSTAQNFAAAHTEVLAEVEEVASQQSIAPEESPISKKLKKASKHTLGKLESADAAEFDTVFVQSQIKVHDQVLDIIDEQLLPAVRNPELRTLTQKNREAVAGHLEQLRSLAESQGYDVDAGVPEDAGI